MSSFRSLARWAAAIAVAAALAAPARATTMVRIGLEDLTTQNETVVVGRVLDVHSYWNADASFILSDVRVLASSVLKGQAAQRELTVTVMGGSVGDVTTLIVAGPAFEIGKEYVLFLNSEDLPGAAQVRTVRDLSQGIFDVAVTPGGPRAISQAVRHPLLPDPQGTFEAPGGRGGLALDAMVRDIRRFAAAR
jgi:ribosomal protein L18E